MFQIDKHPMKSARLSNLRNFRRPQAADPKPGGYFSVPQTLFNGVLNNGHVSCLPTDVNEGDIVRGVVGLIKCGY